MVTQELQLSTEPRFSTFGHAGSEMSFDFSSCEPSFYSRPPTPTSRLRARRSWLPPLKFQLPDERDHPALRPNAERPIHSRQQTNVLRRSWLPPLKFQVSTEREHLALEPVGPVTQRPHPLRQKTPLPPVESYQCTISCGRKSSIITMPSPTLQPRARKSWLPPLEFEPAALEPIAERQTHSRQLTPLLPVAFNPGTPPCSRRTSSRASQATTRGTSSTYSRRTSKSDLSRKSSTLSSLSGDSLDNVVRGVPNGTKNRFPTPDVPAIPAIPERYRHPSHNSSNGGQPMPPDSRPPTPPAEFWMYARAEQQNHSNSHDQPPQCMSYLLRQWPSPMA